MPQNAESPEQVKNNLAAEVLRTRGKVRLAAFGYSMLPTLWPGDLLAVEARSFERTRVGNVVLFIRDGRFFIHRVLRKVDVGAQRHLVTRGDGMPEVDAPVMPEQVLGQVIAVHRKQRDVALSACSTIPRLTGRLLNASGRLRSLALRWHAWRSRNELSKSEIAPLQAS